MRKIIHSKFEIDLSNLKLTDTQQNSMFTDGFFAKTTFPFDIILTDELEQQFDFISDYNTSVDTIYDVTYVHYGKQEKAKLEIIQIVGVKMSAVLQYGFDEYPSFSKKLSELSLDNFDLPIGTDIYQHANSVVAQTWPTVNYNFPQVHTDKYNDNEDFVHFEKIINKRVNDNFIKSYYDTASFISYNKNIMQPLPYALHILQKGFLDGGYTLAGNILTDPLLIRSTIFGDVDYFSKIDENTSYNMQLDQNDYLDRMDISDMDSDFAQYRKEITILKKGIYSIEGFACLRGVNSTSYPMARFYLNGTEVVLPYYSEVVDWYHDHRIYDTYFEVTTENSVFSYDTYSYYIFPGDEEILNLNVKLVSENINGDYQTSIINENKIDLRKAVPDITFGEYVTFIKNYLNYDISGIDGDTIFMNKVEDKFNDNSVKDLSMYDQKKPVRKFKQGNSFLLKFQDIESKDYEYKKVFQNKDNVMYSGYSLDAEKTSTIEINGLPLPLLMRSVKTAHAFESNSSKVYIVPYNGLTGALNISLPITDFLLENVHPLYWYLWFKFRINSKTFEWNFISEKEVFTNLIVKDVIHAYRNFHFIKSITKTEIKPGLFEYELETEA